MTSWTTVFFYSSQVSDLWEGRAQQVNYLIDETTMQAKGLTVWYPCCITTWRPTRALHGQHLLLHADNAVCQNKNNTVLHYLSWRVLKGQNPTIRLKFMIPGHTKFAPDRFFGLIKRLYRRTCVSTLADVRNSTTQGQNIPQCTVDLQSGKRYVTWYSWSEYLNTLFRSFPGIWKYHHFRFDVSEPGIVFAKEFNNTEEVKYKLTLQDDWPEIHHQLPPSITPTGMSHER